MLLTSGNSLHFILSAFSVTNWVMLMFSFFIFFSLFGVKVGFGGRGDVEIDLFGNISSVSLICIRILIHFLS